MPSTSVRAHVILLPALFAVAALAARRKRSEAEVFSTEVETFDLQSDSKSGAFVTEDQAYIFSLIGGLVACGALVYLVGWASPGIQSATWKFNSATSSIFVAVFFYSSVKTTLADELSLEAGTGQRLVLNIVLFLVLQVFFQIRLYYMATSEWFRSWSLLGDTQATAILLTHMAAFAATSAVARLQHLLPTAGVVWFAFAGLCSGVVLIALRHLGRFVRYKVAMADGVITEEEEQWMHEVSEIQGEVLSVSMGFAITQCVLYLIARELPAIDVNEAPEGIGQTDANALVSFIVVFGALTAFAAWLSKRSLSSLDRNSVQFGVLQAFPSMMGAAVAWSLLYWGDWQMAAAGFEGAHLSALLLLAVVWTLLGVLFIIAQHFVDPDLRLTERTAALAPGLLVGMSWEKYLSAALEAMVQRDDLSEDQEELVRSICFIVTALAWGNYIYPKSHHE